MAAVIQEIRTRQFNYLWESTRKHKEETLLKACYVLLQAVDLLLTIVGMSFGFSELNVVMRNLLNNPWQLIIIKLVVPIFIAWFVPGRLLIPAIVLLSLVVCWDLKELLLLLL